MKGLRAFLDKNGFFVMLAVCLLIIAASGVWALSMKEPEPATDVSLETAQRLEDAELLRMSSPLEGAVFRDFGETVWLSTLNCYSAHEAIDIAAQKGTPVCATKEGEVTAAYFDKLWGGVVDISHSSGLTTRYAGLAWPVAVAVGGQLLTGQVIGAVGVLPRESADESHLHFALFREGVPVNPALAGLPLQ